MRSKVNPNLVAEIKDAQDKPGVDVVTADPRTDLEGNECQLWFFDRMTGTIRSSLNGFCLDLKGEELSFIYRKHLLWVREYRK